LPRFRKAPVATSLYGDTLDRERTGFDRPYKVEPWPLLCFCFEFAEIPYKEEADKAIAAPNGKDLKGRTLMVCEACPTAAGVLIFLTYKGLRGR
jgi:hypothetical protein